MKQVKIAISLFVIIISHAVTAQSIVKFNMHSSTLHATYDFLFKLSDSYPDNELKIIFERSTYNNEIYQELIRDFEQLSLDNSYFFTSYPATLKSGMMSRDILERNLALSENLSEFMNRSLGIVPQEELSKLVDILQQFVPLYEELVLLPYRKAFEVQERNLLNYVESGSFSAYFNIGLDFYGTKWNNTVPIELNLLLSLDKGNLGARAFNNIAICEAPVDLTDHVTFFSVAMHEIYHVIYDNQSLEMKQDIKKWFDDTKSPNSQYALLLMNEVLATALGNGYVIEQLNGKTDAGEWYGNKYISEMAKAIYPLLRKYIQKSIPIDEAFVQAYVYMYDSRFPQWAAEPDHIFAYRYVAAQSPADWNYIRRQYRYHSYSRYGAPITAAEVEKVKSSPVTKVFIVSQDHRLILDLLKNNFKELKGKKLNFEDEFLFTVNLDDRTRLFIINRHNSSVEELMTKYLPKSLKGLLSN